MKNRITVSEIELTVSEVVYVMLIHRGTRVHKNRPTHGVVFNEIGEATYRFENGESLTCHAGECIFLPQGSTYTVDGWGDGKRFVHAMNFHTVDGETLSPTVFRIRGKDAILSAFRHAERAWRKRESGYREECMAALYRILAQIKSEASVYAPKEQLHRRLLPAVDHINKHFTEAGLSISGLAVLCGISEVYFRRLFRKAFSASPAHYIRERRIAFAKELLRAGEHSVSEVALLSGFGDAAYFSREFKRAVGEPPSEYLE